MILLLPTAASAQLLLEEPFDTSPADGGWTAIAQPVGGFADLTMGKVASGWRVTHPDAGLGLANRSPCFRRAFDGGVGAVTVRYWLNASSVNDEFGMYPVIIQSPANTLAEVRFAGMPMSSFTPVLQCTDATGTFRVCSGGTSPVLSSQTWHLVELRMDGVGSGQGLCRAAVDGTEFCSQPMNWTGLQPTSAFIGLCALQQAWAGAMTMDELRVVAGPQGSRLRINGPHSGTQGDCLRFTIDTIDAFTQQPAPVAAHTPLDTVAFTGAAAFFASDCSTLGSPPELSPAAPVWEVYARAGTIDIRITATASDLLPAIPFSVHITPVDAGVPDAGALDAGTLDAGALDAGALDAGALDAGALDAGALDAGALDAGALDAGALDAGSLDAGSLDAGALDAGAPDAGTLDAGTVDAGALDAGALDAGALDAGALDAGAVDAGALDAGGTPVLITYDVGCGCTGAPLLNLIAAIALLFRRSRR
ncbi:MAG: DUF2125 domain-containing protein [Archangiaceae bacterium]|nr:DUF2125 domain-containing protein [Archangiaceae bacterium]